MGQGYVGLPLAMAAAKAGHQVVGYEPDKERFEMLRSGTSYVEDIHNTQIQRALVEGLYEPARDETMLKDFDIAIITVPTPLKKGVPDLSYVQAAATTLGLYLNEGATVILESTVAPGTTRGVVVPLLEIPSELTAGKDFFVGFSPERIDPGNEKWTFANTPKIVSGLTSICQERVKRFYADLTIAVVAATLEEAELAKVFENTYRNVNIALVNELQRHAHALGVDVYNTIALASTKPFGFTPFWPGPGVGGHCLPVDPTYLSHQIRTEFGDAFQMVELAQAINTAQPEYVVRRLQDRLNEYGRALNGSEILALGAAYKPDTADMRESPAIEVIDLLRSRGARVVVVDPHFTVTNEHQLAEIPEGGKSLGCTDFDAVVLLTPHSSFDLTKVATEAAYVLDTRGVMPDGSNIERL